MTTHYDQVKEEVPKGVDTLYEPDLHVIISQKVEITRRFKQQQTRQNGHLFLWHEIDIIRYDQTAYSSMNLTQWR